MTARIMPGLGIRAGYASGESGWGDALNEDLLLLSAAVQLSVKSISTSLPGTGSTGDIYIVPVGDTDEGLIAVWDNGAWEMIPANRGWIAYVVDVGKHHMFNDTDWEIFRAELPPYSIADDGKVLTVDPTGALTWATPSGGGGVTVFTALTDTPADYTGQALKSVRVKADESGLEFTTPSGGGGGVTVFTALTDTPADYTGQALKSVRVKLDETGLEFTTPSSSPPFSSDVIVANYVVSEFDLSGNRLIGMNVGTANTVTIDSGMSNGEPLAIYQSGGGQTSIVAGAGVTLISADGALKLRTQYSTCTVMKIAADAYLVVGDLAV